MNQFFSSNVRLFLLLLALALLSSCAAGHSDFTATSPAGFWYGLWHGMISVLALVIHLFNDSVRVYEVNNTGGWYDFGFLLGIVAVWSGGSQASFKTRQQKQNEKEWEEIGEKVEKKVMRKLQEWAEDENTDEELKEWEEIGQKVEKKLKRKIREWAEKDD